jgi:aspartate racemase
MPDPSGPDPIGIVACSAPGAALCYETICTEAQALLGPHEHPEIAMHAFSFGAHVRLLQAGDWNAMGQMLLESVNKLASIGAKFAICPDNTVHQALPLIENKSPIPWLHIADAVAAEARRIGAKRLAVLGTRYLMEGPVFAEKLNAAGIEWRIPPAAQRDRINTIIFDELVASRVTPPSQAALSDIITQLHQTEACDAVVLGCTELPLAVTEGISPIPTLDSTRLLARAAIRRSVSG